MDIIQVHAWSIQLLVRIVIKKAIATRQRLEISESEIVFSMCERPFNVFPTRICKGFDDEIRNYHQAGEI